jgi:hypothetical protein
MRLAAAWVASRNGTGQRAWLPVPAAVAGGGAAPSGWDWRGRLADQRAATPSSRPPAANNNQGSGTSITAHTIAAPGESLVNPV